MADAVLTGREYVGRSKLWTPRWYPLKEHGVQTRLVESKARFKVVPAGRRSGKTERAKREGIKIAYTTAPPGSQIGFGAPVRQQAKDIFWDDLLAMVHPSMMRGDPKVTDLTIPLVNGVTIRVVGMDKPARVEGQPWFWFCLDEYANCKEESWAAHLYPALSTIGQEGSAWLIGVPEGRNHYYEIYKRALADESGVWEGFTWPSEDILPASTIEQARKDLDPLTFDQEYRASFVNFAGMAYYPFREEAHAVSGIRAKYNPRLPLILMFDFNVEPGVCAIGQEIMIPDIRAPAPQVVFEGRSLFKEQPAKVTHPDIEATAILSEVHIPRNSNTPAVCNKIIEQYGDHEGTILLYGDATGGARGTAQLHGSDWDLILKAMYGHFGNGRVTRRGHQNPSNGKWSNPSERSRVNAVNTRLMTHDRAVRLVIDKNHAPNVVRDFEGVRLLEGGSGEIDKKDGELAGLTHLTDGIGYYIEHRFPTSVGPKTTVYEDVI